MRKIREFKNLTDEAFLIMLEMYMSMPTKLNSRRATHPYTNHWLAFCHMIQASDDRIDDEDDVVYQLHRFIHEKDKVKPLAATYKVNLARRLANILQVGCYLSADRYAQFIRHYRTSPKNEWSKKSLNKEQLNRMFNALWDEASAAAPSKPYLLGSKLDNIRFNIMRTTLCLNLMLFYGLRVSEVESIQVADVEIGTEVIKLTHSIAKTAGERRTLTIQKDVPLYGRGTWGLLFDMYHSYRTHKSQYRAGAYFIEKGYDRMPKGYWVVFFSRLSKVTGDHLTAHKLRHTCGTMLTRANGIYAANQILNHKHIETTQLYVQKDEALGFNNANVAKALGITG